MGYRCAIDGEHHEGKPVKVVTKIRNVIYGNNEHSSRGTEIVKEILVHPDNVDRVPEAQVEDKVKNVFCKNFGPKIDFSTLSDEMKDNLQTWNEYKHNMRYVV